MIILCECAADACILKLELIDRRRGQRGGE
jgi:hypothetical protein